MNNSLSVVMLGASGAVGQQALAQLLVMPQIQKVTLLGRKPLAGIQSEKVQQHTVDVFDPSSYSDFLQDHQVAICTFGVGQPSQMSKEEFVRIDKDAVENFAGACKKAGVKHFELLSAVGGNPDSGFHYLRTKGELNSALEAMQFERLSLFLPSMILTPVNRYGIQQAFTLALWPILSQVLLGGWRKYRGIRVETLGAAMAKNVLVKGSSIEHLTWDQFMSLA